MFYHYLDKIDPRLWAIPVSLLISFILGWNFIINPDGIIYLNTADSFLNNHEFIPPVGAKWPFYSLLIAGLSAITGFSTQTSALIWQALFMALLIISFINVIRLLGGNRTLQHIAALVLLLHPDLNENRDMIIRDFGYWAFLFTGFYYLLRYLDEPSWLPALLWTLSMSIAILFRIEGVVIAMLAPLLVFFLPHYNIRKKILHMARLYSIWILFTLLGLCAIFWQHREISLTALGRIAEFSVWWQHLTGGLLIQWENIRDSINILFPQMKNPHINIFLIGGLIAYVLYRLITTLGIVFTGITVYGQSVSSLNHFVSRMHRKILYGFLAINFFIIIVFVMHNWFVASRYLIASTLVLLVWVPFTLVFIAKKWHQTHYALRYPWLGKNIVILLGIFLFVDCYISFGPSPRFIKQSADWIEINIPQQATLYSNSAPLAYYANRPGTNWYANNAIIRLPEVLKKKTWKNYDYVAFYINRNDKQLAQDIAKQFIQPPLAEFNNSHGDRIMIYKIH